MIIAKESSGIFQVSMSSKVERLREQVLSKINRMEIIDDDRVMELVENMVYQDLLYEPIEEKEDLIVKLFNEFRRLGPLQPLLNDDEITEIMINGEDQVYLERKGKMEEADIGFQSNDEIFHLIQKIVNMMDRKVNEKHPICDVRLHDGSRVNIVLSPIALKGPTMTIRKFPKKRLTKKDLIENMTIDHGSMAFLENLVKKKYNLFISGGTSSGKTTLLNILSDAIPTGERIITIEDSAELQLSSINNLVSLEARTSSDHHNHVSIRDLIKSSLRMRPDRIIVGEVRGEETIDMLQGMNTGHDGSISTGHANTTQDMLFRLETMVLSGMNIPLIAIRQQISSALDIMIHIQKIRDLGRRVVEISEVVGMVGDQIQLSPLYLYDEKEDRLKETNTPLVHMEKWLWN